MSSRNLLNLGLLIFIVILVILLIYTPGKDEPAKTKLTTLKQGDITHIKFTRNTLPPVALTKQNGHWYMSDPYQVPANDFQVQTLLRLIETNSLARYDLHGKDLTKYKLDKPQASITFNDALTIEFGGTAALNQNRYVRIGDTMHLIIDTFFYQLNTKATYFVSHALLPSGSQITLLQLPDLKLELQDGKWNTSPQQEGFSADATTELINAWQFGQAMDIQPYTKKLNPESIKETITVALKKQHHPIQLELIKSNEKFILGRRDLGLQYIFPMETAEQLLRLPQPEELPVEKKPDTSTQDNR